MNRLKIVIWGISDAIMHDIRNELNPKAIEIVGFVDNDERKQGTSYMGIPVTTLKEQETENVDYFLVSAFSAYKEIKEQLVREGIPNHKIQVFITDQLCNYCLDDLGDVNTEFIHKVYLCPNKIILELSKYQNVYEKYSKLQVYQETQDEWFDKSRLISHACGGVVNGKRVPYSNSAEAFRYTTEAGFQIMECDVCKMDNGEWVLAHDYEAFWRSEEEKYTMMTLRELLVSLRAYPHISCLVDVKWKSYGEYAECVDVIEQLIQDVCLTKEEYDILKSQMVMEVYDELTIQIAREKSFKVIFTQYRNPDYMCFMNTVNLCYKYEIRAIAISASWHRVRKKALEKVTDKNIRIFAFSTDSIEEYATLREKGVTGIFTNYLTEKDIE